MSQPARFKSKHNGCADTLRPNWVHSNYRALDVVRIKERSMRLHFPIDVVGAAVGLLLVGTALSAIDCAQAAPSALDVIRTRGVLLVGTTSDYSPFSRRSRSGDLAGADIDMARSLATTIGVGVEFVPTTWTTLLDDFASHRFDVAMGGVTITPERAAKGEFSIPVMSDGKRPIVRCADKERLNSIAAIDQANVRVVTPPGGTNEAFAKSTFKTALVTVFPNNVAIFDEIAAGRMDVMVTDGVEVDHQSTLHAGILCPASVAAPFSHFQKAYLLPQDDEMKQFVDRWLARQLAAGAWSKALDKATRE
jgi:cyclohexadienyl dehydratase